jgi:hypothetical protein
MATAKAQPKERPEYSQIGTEAVGAAHSIPDELYAQIKAEIMAEMAASGDPAVKSPGMLGQTPRAARKGDIAYMDRQRKSKLRKYYESEDKVPVSASPVYAPYVGNIQQIIVNDAWVTLPCNGETYPLPKTFADAWLEKKYALDKLIAKQQRMASYDANKEAMPGSLNF